MRKNPTIEDCAVSPRGRIEGLDAIRGLASMNVVLVHAIGLFDFGFLTGNPAYSNLEPDSTLLNSTRFLQINGDLPVCLFFILSGYVLTSAFSNSDTTILGATVRRYLRLMPMILACCMISFLLFSIFGELHKTVAIATKSYGAALNLPNGIPSALTVFREGLYGALLGQFSYGTTINSALWTMPIEFQGSILIIILTLPPRVMGVRHYNSRIQFALHLAFFICFASFYLSLFSIGAMMNLAAARYSFKSKTFGLTLCLTGLLLSLVPAAWIVEHLALPPSFPLFFNTEHQTPASFYRGIGATVLLAGILIGDFPVFYRRAFQHLGRNSFALYLIHMPIVLTVGSYVFIHLRDYGYWPAASIAFAVAVLCSYFVAMILTSQIDDKAILVSKCVGRAADEAAAGVCARVTGRTQ